MCIWHKTVVSGDGEYGRPEAQSGLHRVGEFPPARGQTETTMITRNNMSGESAFFAVTAIAICVVLVAGIVGLLAPAAANPHPHAPNTPAYPRPAPQSPRPHRPLSHKNPDPAPRACAAG